MTSSTRTSNPVNDVTPPAGLLDTSAVIDLEKLLDKDAMPARLAISAVTMAELAAGPAAATDSAERARRQDRLQRVESTFDPIPFGIEAARAFGRIYSAVVDAGRKPRRRMADLLIASVALAEDLPLVTRNPDDFLGLEGLVTIIAV